jgi:hypothetical protein
LNNKILKPMTQDQWSHTLETLIDWIDLHDTLSDAVVVRRFMEVVARAPHPDLIEGVGDLDAATIDRLLAAGACDALAMRLIGEDSGFFASRGGGGEYLVSVMLAGRETDMTAAGSTLTRAIVGALALILSQPEPAASGRAERGGLEHGYAGVLSAAMAGATLH